VEWHSDLSPCGGRSRSGLKGLGWRVFSGEKFL
jgi:hypothetical protein